MTPWALIVAVIVARVRPHLRIAKREEAVERLQAEQAERLKLEQEAEARRVEALGMGFGAASEAAANAPSLFAALRARQAPDEAHIEQIVAPYTAEEWAALLDGSRTFDDPKLAPRVTPIRRRTVWNAREAEAKAIYDSWSSQPGWVPWVQGGNSLMQDKARREASDVWARISRRNQEPPAS